MSSTRCSGPIRPVEHEDEIGFACAFHIGRAPCLIPFCGRTFKVEAGSSFLECEFLCGKHFRMAPAGMRSRLKRIERIAKKRGFWTEGQSRAHSYWWKKIKASIMGDLSGFDFSDAL